MDPVRRLFFNAFMGGRTTRQGATAQKVRTGKTPMEQRSPFGHLTFVRSRLVTLIGCLTLTLGVCSCFTSNKKTPKTPEQKNQAPQPPENPEGKESPPKSPSQCPEPEALALPRGTSLSTQDEPLLSLTANHPRIFVTPERLTTLKNLLKNGDPIITEMADGLAKKISEIEKRPPLVPTSDSSTNARLVSSPEAMDRILALAGSYLLTGDRRHGLLAIDVMKAAANFSDWHPSHFLDTSVMAYAVAVGYDWTYDLLSDEERRVIRSAILEKGIRPALQEYEKRIWWTQSKDNWPLVNGGAIGIAALAIGDVEKEASSTVLKYIVQNLELPLKSFEPDGAWAEGPMYWGYGSLYLYGLADALRTATGTDLGLSQRDSLRQSGLYRVHAVGPNKKWFSYYDTGEGIGSYDFMMWKARQYQTPLFAQTERRLGGLSGIRAILWYAPGCFAENFAPPAPSHVYPRLAVATLRTAWNDPSAVYIGFKGGDNKTSHGHLDLGNFVLDADGERWAVDLGADSYTVPGYFDSRIRPTLYRVSTQGHNTLTIAQEAQKNLAMPNQKNDAVAPLLAFRGEASGTSSSNTMQQKPLPRLYAVADLKAAYIPLVTKALRGVGIQEDNSVLIIDEIAGGEKPISVVSHFHTRAKVEISGREAILTQGGKTLKAKILSPTNARFEVISANPRDIKTTSQENPNRDVRDLIVRIGGLQQATKLILWLVPGSAVKAEEPSLEGGIAPLSEWVQADSAQKFAG